MNHFAQSNTAYNCGTYGAGAFGTCSETVQTNDGDSTGASGNAATPGGTDSTTGTPMPKGGNVAPPTGADSTTGMSTDGTGTAAGPLANTDYIIIVSFALAAAVVLAIIIRLLRRLWYQRRQQDKG